MKKIILMILITTLISSCASIPKNAPSFSLKEKPVTGSNLYIYRLGTSSTMLKMNVYIDKKLVVTLPEKGYTVVNLNQQPQNIQAMWPAKGAPTLDFQIEITEGSDNFLKITGNFQSEYIKGGTTGIEIKNSTKRTVQSMRGSLVTTEAGLVDESASIQELQECCKYIEPSINNF